MATATRSKPAPTAPPPAVAPDEAVGPATREKLIQTAARHFAEYGFEAASLRAIQRELGVNPASVHYHFGSKRAVYEAIMEAYLGRIQAERSRRFDSIDPALTGEARLRALLLAYVEPHLEVVRAEDGEAYGRLMARGVMEPNSPGPDLIQELAPLRERFLTEFGRLFPEAGRARLARALSYAIILMVTTPFDRGYLAMTGKRARTETLATWVGSVVDYAAAGFIATCGEVAE